jgi:glycosyltransferase involved in cell wall biosynthesis
MPLQEDEMKVYIVSNFSGSLDEGMMNVAFQLGNSLAKHHDVFYMNARKTAFSLRFWMKTRKSRPDIIHVILRPSAATLSLVQLLKLWCAGAKVFLSALQPPAHFTHGIFFKIRPDAVLVQSYRTQLIFDRLGYKTSWLPNGVDAGRFHPVSEKTKRALREKYKVHRDNFVVLHVGHILKGRNLGVFSEISKQRDNQVVIVGGTIFKPDRQTRESLVENGCIVWQKYFPNIEEIYQLADCYVFPVVNSSNCIELPLSVMEAMSCNLPVLSTNFGGLKRLFKEGDGLVFTDRRNLREAFDKFKEEIKKNVIKVKTREKVLHLTWQEIASQLDSIYVGEPIHAS